MGSNNSRQSKQNISKTDSTERSNIDEKIYNTSNFLSEVHRSTSRANNPFQVRFNNPHEHDPYNYNDLSRQTANKSHSINLNVQHTINNNMGTCNDRKSHVNSKEKKEDAYYQLRTKLRELELSTNPVNTHFEVATEAFHIKKKYLNENCAESNEPTNESISSPSMICTKDDFMTIWFSWKNEFFTYMKSIDPMESNKHKWGIMLLNRMGPVGQEIYRTFTFNNDCIKEDIHTLIKKFDDYCIFGDRKRRYNEEIDKYINDLKIMALKHMTNTDQIVKEKILKEIDEDKFTNQAKILIPTFSFTSSIQSLTLKEITYIWITSENGNFKQNEIIDNFLVRNCNNCGETHGINKCRAYGKQCNKCGNTNHFWIRCPSQFINNCIYCGADHFIRQCPSYFNECSKCHRMNHFPWKCSTAFISNCNFCGLSHIASKSACYAINSICKNCSQKGHFVAKCKKK